MKLLCVPVICLVMLSAAGKCLAAGPSGDSVTLDFDDIAVFPKDYLDLTGSNYGGLTWGTSSNPGLKGNAGFWIVDDGSSDPYGNGLVNAWGASELTIGFPRLVSLQSTLAGAQGETDLQAAGIQFLGYRDGVVVWETGWYSDLVRHDPYLIDFSLPAIDTLLVRAARSNDAVAEGGHYGAYRLDDLRFAYVPEPASLLIVGLIVAALACKHRNALSGSWGQQC